MNALRVQLRGAFHRPARLLLTGLALIVIAFSVYGVVLARSIATESVLQTYSGTPAAAELVVRGAHTDLSTLAAVRAVPGVAEATGRIQGPAQLLRPSSADVLLEADPGAGALSTVRVVRGRYPRTGPEVAVPVEAAQRLGVSIGSKVVLDTADPGATTATGTEGDGTGARATLTVTALVEAPGRPFTTLYGRQPGISDLIGNSRLDQIDVRLVPGASLPAVRTAVAAAVAAPGREILPGAQVRALEAEEAAGWIDSLAAVVAMFVAIAVAAGVLVATSTFRIVFAQRMRQLALLRAVGAGRADLVRALAVEGMLTGGVAGSIGVALAGAAGLAVPPVLHAFDVTAASVRPPAGPAIAVVTGTVLISLLAVLGPAVSASRVSPLEALRSAETVAGRDGIGWIRAGSGVLLGLAALASYARLAGARPGAGEGSDAQVALLGIVGSGTLAYFALVTLGPVVVRPVLKVVGWPVRRLGPIGELAVGGVGGSTRRAAAVTVVVALSVTLVGGVLIGISSLAELARRETAISAPSDFQVAVPAGRALPDGVLARTRQQDELIRVTPYRRAEVAVQDGSRSLTRTPVDAIDLPPRAFPRLGGMAVRDGSLERLGPGRAVVVSYVAQTAHLTAGSTVTLAGGDRRVTVTVAAVVEGTPLGAAFLIDPSDLTGLGVPAGPTGILADAARPGPAGRDAARQALLAASDGAPAPGAATATDGGSDGAAGGDGAATGDGAAPALIVLAEDRDRIDAAVGQFLAICLGLIGLTVLVGVVGVATTTALSVVERVRESGVLRAVGLTRAGLGAVLTLEAGVYGLLGATLGLLLAIPYSWLAVSSLGEQVPVTMPLGSLALTVAVLTLLTALAGLVPAWRASAVSPTQALATVG